MAGGSPDTHRLAAEAAEEIGSNQFFEAEFINPLESLEHYCRSSLGFQRLAYAQGIAAAALTAGYQDCVEVLLRLAEQLSHDNEPEIRKVAVQQLCGLGTALHQKDAERSLRDIEATLLVCAQQCALDDEEEVNQAAILAFQELVVFLPAARATAASKRAVDRLESNGADDGTLAAVRLLSYTVHTWIPEALRRHVPRYVNRWANHREFSVREAVGTCMSLIVKAMPLQLCHQLLLPLFYQICRDSNWRVRRACSADLPRLAQAMQQHQQQQQQHHQHEHQQSQQHQGLPPIPSKHNGNGSTSNKNSNSNSSNSNDSSTNSHVNGSSINSHCNGSSSNPSSSNNNSNSNGSRSCADHRDSSNPDGSCSSKASSCLYSTRHTTELSSLSTGNLQALSNSISGAHRNRSASSITVPTTAQISAKHPMASSLIRHDLLTSTSASPNTSAPPSPTSSQQLSHSSIDSRQPEPHVHNPSSRMSSVSQQEPRRAASDCPLEASTPMLHDCWCALRQCMELLSADSSHWVKVAAMSGLGPFLLALPSCQVSLLLLGRFTSMAGSTVVIYEISVALACAQHFGALVVRLGVDRWQEMRDAWQALQMSRDPAVLCELIKCLPGLISALGPAITCQELMPALAVLLQSHLTWVAPQLVAVLGDLMEVLPPSGQDMLLKVLSHLATPHGERSRLWRLRCDLALQLGCMAAAAGPEAITDSIWPTAIALCYDPVSSVRTAAASQVGMLLAALPGSLLAPKSSEELGGCSYTQPARASAAKVSPPEYQNGFSNDDAGGASSSDEQCSSDSSDGSDAGVDLQQQCHSQTQETATGDELHATEPSSSSRSSLGRSHSSPVPAAKVLVYGASYGSEFCDYGRRQRPEYGVPDDGSTLDDLDLPSALAPAPADAFSALAGLGDRQNTSGSPDQQQAREGVGHCLDAHNSSMDGGNIDHGDESDDDVDDDATSHHDSSSTSSSSSSSVGSDSDDDPVLDHYSGRGNQQQQQYSAVMHPALQYQLPPLPDQQQQQQQESDIYNIRRTIVVPQAEVATSSVLPVITGEPQHIQQQQQQQDEWHHATSLAVHPAMMPVGRPNMMSVGSTLPAAQPRPVPQARVAVPPRAAPLPAHTRSSTTLTAISTTTATGTHLKAKSTGDLLKVEAAQQQQQQHKRCKSSFSMPASQQPPASVGSSSSSNSSSSSRRDGFDPALPEPGIAAPHQYVACLLSYFGCSSNFQQRQLFVPLVMSILSACHDKLTCDQATQLLDRLEGLATDAVPGVRYAVAVALQHLRQHAAALLNGQQQQHQRNDVHGAVTQAQQPKPSESSCSAGAVGDETAKQQLEADVAVSLDSYASYVKELASRSITSQQADSAKGIAAAGRAAGGSADADDCNLNSGSVVCSPACAVCGVLPAHGNDDGLEWLRKLCSCQQLERLMGVVALTTGPLRS